MKGRGAFHTHGSSHTTSTWPLCQQIAPLSIPVMVRAAPGASPRRLHEDKSSQQTPRCPKIKTNLRFCFFSCLSSQLLSCSFHACERWACGQLWQSKLILWGRLTSSSTPSFHPVSSSCGRAVFSDTGWQKQVTAGATNPPLCSGRPKAGASGSRITNSAENSIAIRVYADLWSSFQLFRGAKKKKNPHFSQMNEVQRSRSLEGWWSSAPLQSRGAGQGWPGHRLTSSTSSMSSLGDRLAFLSYVETDAFQGFLGGHLYLGVQIFWGFSNLRRLGKKSVSSTVHTQLPVSG